MKTIPEVREELKKVADGLKSAGNMSSARKILRLVKDMHRRPSIRRAARDSVAFTPKIEMEIIAYAHKHPDASYQSMAKRFNVAVGRISEALVGRRSAA